jgi:recombination protein RecA
MAKKSAAAKDNSNPALQAALDSIEKQFGRGAIMRLGQDYKADVEAIPTGSLTLDIALGIGGIPRGRVIEIYGPESSGKTTLTLHMVASAQKSGTAAFIDAEHALDPVYAKKLGVNLDELLVSQPDSGEQALEICDMLVRSATVDLIVIDSVAALVPKAELDGDMGDTHVGTQARMMSQAMRKLTGIIGKTRTSVIFINQIRSKIGVIYGSPEVTTGGNALKYYSSVRLDIRKKEVLKKGTDMYGTHVMVKVVKNKVAPPFRIAEFDIIFNEGISQMGELVDLALQFKVLVRTGSWFSYDGSNIGQGKEAAINFLKENRDVAKDIYAKIKETQDDDEKEAAPAADKASEKASKKEDSKKDS